MDETTQKKYEVTGKGCSNTGHEDLWWGQNRHGSAILNLSTTRMFRLTPEPLYLHRERHQKAVLAPEPIWSFGRRKKLYEHYSNFE